MAFAEFARFGKELVIGAKDQIHRGIGNAHWYRLINRLVQRNAPFTARQPSVSPVNIQLGKLGEHSMQLGITPFLKMLCILDFGGKIPQGFARHDLVMMEGGVYVPADAIKVPE
jgi:hypothetical protein